MTNPSRVGAAASTLVTAAALSDGSGGGGGGGTRSTIRVFAVVVFKRPVRSLSLNFSSALRFASISAIAAFMHSVGSNTDGCSQVPLNLGCRQEKERSAMDFPVQCISNYSCLVYSP